MMVDVSKAQRSIEGTSKCAAPAATVWKVWTNPEVWPGDVIVAASIDGPFALGAQITTRVRGFPTARSTVTRIEHPNLWVGVSKAPGLTITYEHIIETAGDGTVLTERAVLSGPLAAAAARLMGNRLDKTLVATTAHCARLAEAQS